MEFVLLPRQPSSCVGGTSDSGEAQEESSSAGGPDTSLADAAAAAGRDLSD